MHIVLLLILLLAIEIFAAGIILRRLQDRHPEVWAELGLKDSEESGLSEKWLAMTRFIYSGASFKLDDVPLNVLCATIVIGEVGIVYVVIVAGTA